jgi:uncharacterized membrane protein YeiH
MSIIQTIDILGTLVFAISGVSTAIERRFDLVGAIEIGFVTALGGGTLRDLLLGTTPVGWMTDLSYLGIIAVAVVITYLGLGVVTRLRRTTFLFDTLGIGLFTVLGVEKTLALGLSPVIAVIMGVVSASFGGVIRDVLCGEVPLIFRSEIYATACAAGGVVYLLADHLNPVRELNLTIAIGVVIAIRILAIRYGWNLSLKPL